MRYLPARRAFSCSPRACSRCPAQRTASKLAGYTKACLALFLASAASAQTSPADKSGFTLFNPTPKELMREMDTDRPDTTESPISVDAGHFQIEMSFVDFAYNDDGPERTSVLSIAPANIKVGLLSNVDIQFVFTPYVREETRAAGQTETNEGFSDDTQIRLKINLWGNDGPDPVFGPTAFAIMPFVKFPTGSGDLSNDHVEGGLILPASIDLPAGFNLGLMAEFDVVYNDARDDYGIDFVHTATVNHQIIGDLSGYLEYVGIAPHETGGTYQAIASGGLKFAISKDWVLDCGGTVGISDSADDFTVFIGNSIRF